MNKPSPTSDPEAERVQEHFQSAASSFDDLYGDEIADNRLQRMLRPGLFLRAEAAVDLVRSGGLPPVGLLAEIVSPVDPFRMALPSELANFALDHGLTELTLSEVLQFRQNPSHDRRLIGQRGWCRP